MVNKTKESEIDVFRDTPVRYLGYTNEVGEAFRSLIPKSVVWFSYIAASGYVLADTIHKGIKTYNVDESPKKIKRCFLSASDTLLWQSFASVIIPGLTINRLCVSVSYMQKKFLYSKLRTPWIPTIIGIASIPVIIRPIDMFVEYSMNVTYRKWIGYHPKVELNKT